MQKQISKFPIVGMNQDDDDYTVPPGFAREIRNMIPKNDGLSRASGVQNLKGTTFIQNLVGSTSILGFSCIGTYEDRANNRMFFFLKSDEGKHRICYYSPDITVNNGIVLVLENQGLNFSSEHPISSVSSIDDILLWTDNYNEPRSIVVADAVAGMYSPVSIYLDLQISIQKYNPPTPPVVSLVTDTSLTGNQICSDSYQFAYRFVHRDSTVSMFSPLSQLIPASKLPDPTSTTSNKVQIDIELLSPAFGTVKTVQLACVKNNLGDYMIFDEFQMPTSSTVQKFFTGIEGQSQVAFNETIAVNLTPRKSSSVLVSSQRAILTMDEFDYEATGSSSLFLAPAQRVSFAGANLEHCPGSTYEYGIVYFDARMRTNGVVSKKSIGIQQLPLDYSSYGVSTYPSAVQFTIIGSAPSWAKYWMIVRKRNSTVQSIFGTPSIAMFYCKDYTDGDSKETSSGVNGVVDNGKLFYTSKTDPGFSGTTSSNLIFWKLPVNIPVNLDSSYSVRLLGSIGQTRSVEPIIEVQGDKIITKNFGVNSWTSNTADFCYPTLQIFKTGGNESELFFETGDMGLVTAQLTHTSLTGGIATGIIGGDMYAVSFDNYRYAAYEFGMPSYGILNGNIKYGQSSAFVISQSPTINSVSRITGKSVEVGSEQIDGVLRGNKVR
jgi:hypothetical protein